MKNKLTITETKVFNLVIEGLSYSEIAEKLNITVCTVKCHVMHILQKTNARDTKILIVQYYKKLLEQ